MAPGFTKFSEIFEPYEDYVCDQTKAVDYLRGLTSNAEFMTYLTWCNSQNTADRYSLSKCLQYSTIFYKCVTPFGRVPDSTANLFRENFSTKVGS